MRAAGLELLPVPSTITTTSRRFALGIMYEEDEGGRYFQVYTRVVAERFFFEIVQRDGYTGFGAPNAPIRLAAQARLSRQPAAPRS